MDSRAAADEQASETRARAGALTGLSLGVLALVAALLLARVLSQSLPVFGSAALDGDLGPWFEELLGGYIALLKMAVPMVILITATGNLGPQHGIQRVAALGAAIVLSAGIGTQLRLIGWDADWDEKLGMMRYVWPRYALLGAMLTLAGELYRRQVATNRAAHRAELERTALEKEWAEARLQVLEAQIEPHFLFNTLANVRRLYAEDPARGRVMLETLLRYLELALPAMRERASTLARDAELIEAYLGIQAVRMGPRLRFTIDIPPHLRSHRIPPMMLLTLVENSIKHGLSRKPEGGSVRVSAAAEQGRLILTVTDTGVGFTSGAGAGTGLANLSTRLAAEFGDEAGLSLANDEAGGATATLFLPLAAGDSEVAASAARMAIDGQSR